MASAIQRGMTTFKTFSKPPLPARSADLCALPAGLGPGVLVALRYLWFPSPLFRSDRGSP